MPSYYYVYYQHRHGHHGPPILFGIFDDLAEATGSWSLFVFRKHPAREAWIEDGQKQIVLQAILPTHPAFRTFLEEVLDPQYDCLEQGIIDQYVHKGYSSRKIAALLHHRISASCVQNYVKLLGYPMRPLGGSHTLCHQVTWKHQTHSLYRWSQLRHDAGIDVSYCTLYSRLIRRTPPWPIDKAMTTPSRSR